MLKCPSYKDLAGRGAGMPDQEDAYRMIVRFRDGLSRAVELGYGDDDCGPVVSAMFDSLVRDAFPGEKRFLSSSVLRIRWEPQRNTCSDLLSQTTRIMQLAERRAAKRNRRRGSRVVFPFLTSLAISGGLFMLSFRIAPFVLSRLLLS